MGSGTRSFDVLFGVSLIVGGAVALSLDWSSLLLRGVVGGVVTAAAFVALLSGLVLIQRGGRR